MALEAGEAVFGDDVVETRGNNDASAGDAVMIDGSGDMTPANTEAGDLAGVMTEAGGLGIAGTFVVAAADDVSAGDHVNAGNATGTSTGTVIAESGGKGLALSDEGGTWHGENGTYDVPAGYAVVNF